MDPPTPGLVADKLTGDPPPVASEEEAMCFCPVCSTRLGSLRCKLVCERCGYFMSCADYY